MTCMLRVVSACLLFALVGVAQNDEVVPNENLVVEGVTKIPASLAESVDRYGDSREAFLSSWHPTRREMLITPLALPTLSRFTA